MSNYGAQANWSGDTGDEQLLKAVIWFPGASTEFVIAFILVFAILIAVYYIRGGDE